MTAPELARSLPPEQEAIRAKCFHPAGEFIEFPLADVETSIPARFEKMARAYPERVAVARSAWRLNYGALNGAANNIAAAIVERCGDSRSEPVGLLFRKGVGFVVGLLGILKAGKICAPLDPALPPERLSLMCADMQARLLITDEEGGSLASRLAEPQGWLTIENLLAGPAPANPRVSVSPDAVACLFYTSGSTAQPKAVVETHGNLLRSTARDTADYHLCAEDRMTFVASSGRDIFRALLNGAAIFPVDLRREGFAGLGRTLIDHEITILNCVASAFRGFAQSLSGDERFDHLRLIKLNGETVYQSDYQLFHSHFAPECILVNTYGPTECGTICQYLMDKSRAAANGVLPVGYPVFAKEVWLEDANGGAVPCGTPGEIVVKSRYLSNGYWRATQELPAPFCADPSDEQAKIYRTGDIGVLAPDGCLTHLGRKDSLVKIRGNQVVTSAVETVLLSLGVLSKATVLSALDRDGDRCLIAYVVARQRPGPSAAELRDRLQEIVPSYMIPNRFVFLDDLPVTGNGKVNRRALQPPDRQRPRLDAPYIAPGTEIEKALASIWAEVLSVDPVGIHDDFFALGGHSLAAMRVVARVIQTFQFDLALQELINAPTVAAMAQVIAGCLGRQTKPEDLERLLAEVEAMTEAEAQKLLAGQA